MWSTDSDGDGVIDGEDQCPDENASLLDEDGDGCLDDEDGDGVLDSDDACPLTELDETVDETGCSEGQLSVMDDDNDGVSNLNDLCPDTAANVSVDATGCAEEVSVQDGGSSSFLDSFFSGDSDPVTTTVGIGAILIALFGLLQTNAVAALLPDSSVKSPSSELQVDQRRGKRVDLLAIPHPSLLHQPSGIG